MNREMTIEEARSEFNKYSVGFLEEETFDRMTFREFLAANNIKIKGVEDED